MRIWLTAILAVSALTAGANVAQARTKGDSGPYIPLPFTAGGRVQTTTGALGPTDDPADAALHFPATGPIVRHQWPGTYFTAAFKGDRVYLRFNDPYNRYRVRIDGPNGVEISQPGNKVVQVAGLGDHRHIIHVEKLTESWSHAGTFNGFFLPAGETALPVPTRTRQIEIIGDSYSAGYGTTSLKQTCTQDEIRDTTDTQRAFGPLTAKHYDADYQVNAVSGIGMVRFYDGLNRPNIPDLYPYTLFDKSVPYRAASWQPQIVVIALGDNDFSPPPKPGEKWADMAALRKDFIATYEAFVKGIRAHNPKATFILMDYGEAELVPDLKVIAADLKASGETRVLTFSPDPHFEQTGCDGHLTLNDHMHIASELEAFIDAHPQIWNGK